MTARKPFDPLRLLGSLERARVAYVVVGELAEVLQGSGGVADRTEIVPSLRADNLDRLRRAMRELEVSESALGAVSDAALIETNPPTVLQTSAGELVISPIPNGTRGWDDLRRGAERQPLGGGVRPAVAGIEDLVRMNEVSAGPERVARGRTLRRMIELSREMGIDL